MAEAREKVAETKRREAELREAERLERQTVRGPGIHCTPSSTEAQKLTLHISPAQRMEEDALARREALLRRQISLAKLKGLQAEDDEDQRRSHGASHGEAVDERNPAFWKSHADQLEERLEALRSTKWKGEVCLRRTGRVLAFAPCTLTTISPQISHLFNP